jgi:methionine synthase I (cobalamin-dependent)
MGAFGDAYKAIESVILLRSRVETLERSLEKLIDEAREQGRDLLDHERRLIRIETMIEMSQMRSGKPRIGDE